MSQKDKTSFLNPADATVWELVSPKPWEEDESGLILASKEDIRNGAIPLLLGEWSSGFNGPPNEWIPYSDIVDRRIINWDKDSVLFIDEICIADEAGNRRRIPVPPGSSAHFYACGLGIYSNSEKLVFLNVSPHTWCGINNTSLTTVDLRSFSLTLQHLGEPGFICSYLEQLTGHSADDPSEEIHSWSNGDVDLCLCENGDKLLLAAESPALTLEMDWQAGGWEVMGQKNGRCVPRNEAFYLLDMDHRSSY